MNGKHFIPAIILLLSAFAASSCDQASNVSTVFTGSVQGFVYDTLTGAPIPGAKNFADDITDTVLTDAEGMYMFHNINLPRSDYIYYIKSTKQGYDTSIIRVKAKSDNIVKADTAYLKMLSTH